MGFTLQEFVSLSEKVLLCQHINNPLALTSAFGDCGSCKAATKEAAFACFCGSGWAVADSVILKYLLYSSVAVLPAP